MISTPWFDTNIDNPNNKTLIIDPRKIRPKNFGKDNENWICSNNVIFDDDCR